MSDACDLLVRGRAVCKALRGPPAVGALDAIACKPLDTRAEYSADGRFLAVVEEGALRVLDAVSGAVLLDQPRPQVQALSLSPRGSFLLTWERSQQEGSDVGNLQIWRVAPAELVCHYAQKALGEKALWPAVRWSADEAIAFRLVTNEVHFFDGQAPTQQAKHKLRIEGVLQCALAPGGPPYRLATFVPEKKGAPATVRLWQYPDFGEGRFLATKTFYKASEVQLMWAPNGTALLIHTHTEVDKTGKSYYGETGLFHMNVAGQVTNVKLSKEGPIHDVQWSPKGDEFVAVFGYSPSKAVIFNTKCEEVYNFGEAPRNTVRWSPHARFLIIAGFGNLSGELSFWDRKTCKCLGTVDAHMSVNYEWSPDSKYFLTAILFPRLRVDNGYRIWSCNGNLLHEEKIEELSLAQWRPQPADRFAAPTDADIPKKAGAAKPTSTGSKYVPPSQRGAGGGAGKPAASGRSLADLAGVQERGGSQAIFSGGGGPLGAEVEGEGKNAAKNKAKKEAKKKKAAEGGGAGAAGPAFAVEEPGAPKAAAAAAKGPAGAAEAAEGAMTEEKLEKKIRAVEKKLRQIGELKELKAGGKPLEKNQLDKITAEESVRAELEALQLQMKTSQDSGKWR